MNDNVNQETYNSKMGTPPFAMVPKYITEDLRINGNAHRILTYLIGKKDGWIPRTKDIQERLGLKRGSFETARKQLIKAGYLNQINWKDDRGYNHITYDFYWDPAYNEEYLAKGGDLPNYDVHNKKGSPENTDKPQTQGNVKTVNKGTNTKSIHGNNKNQVKKSKKFIDNVQQFNPGEDPFFEK